MKPNELSTPRIAVIGGGISGIAAALHLNRHHPSWPIVLWEKQDRLGGVLQTRHEAGYLIELAADSFLSGPSAPWAYGLCAELGLADELIPTQAAFRGAQIGWQGRLFPVPDGFQLLAASQFSSILHSPLLTTWGKLRLCCEPLIREPSAPGDESLKQFAMRRVGREAFERLVQPLVAGIFTADAEKLSVAAALPQLVSLVREHGSLYRGLRHGQRTAAAARGARYNLFLAPRKGMSSWVDQLALHLGATDLRCGRGVRALERSDDGAWMVWGDGASAPERFDGVIVATPAAAAARLLEPTDAPLAAELHAIRAASSVVVCVGYRRAQLGRPLNAFGCVIPAVEQRPILAISYASVKFPDRAPDDCELLRIFVGGATHHHLTQLADHQLEALVLRELRHWLDIQGTPQWMQTIRWPSAMPQYEIGHLDRLQRIDERLRTLGGVRLAGNSLRGVGIPQCIQSGQQAADRIAVDLGH